MMMIPEQYTEPQTKAQPLLEKLVKTLNELNGLGGIQPLFLHDGQIVSVGGFVYESYSGKCEVGELR